MRPAVVRHVCVTTAASHADASAFLTPYEDSGSTKEAASPTRSTPSSATVETMYADASRAHGSRTLRASPTSPHSHAVLASSAWYHAVSGARARTRGGSTMTASWRRRVVSGTDQAQPSG